MTRVVLPSILKRLSVLCAVSVLAVALTLAVLPGSARAASVTYSSDELTLVSLINQYRASMGLPKLLLSDTLSSASKRHSTDMARFMFYNHISFRSSWFLAGSDPASRLAQAGYGYKTATEENIGNGWISASEVFGGWKNMTNDRTNMLNSSYKVIGVGLVKGGIYRYYWTVDFGGYVDASAHTPALAAAASADASSTLSAALADTSPTSNAAPANTPSTATAAPASAADTEWGRLPLSFIPNRGQLDDAVDFYVQGADKSVYFTATGTTFALTNAKSPASADQTGKDAARWAVKLDYLGAAPVNPEGASAGGTTVSYFTGTTTESLTGLPTFSSIAYKDLWPGIDLTCSGTAGELKQEYLVQPGADPAAILLAYHGADVSLNAEGGLDVSTPIGGFTDSAPVAYQQVDGLRVPVEVSFSLDSSRAASDEYRYGFRVGAYDHDLPLVIDPAVVIYCGFIGGTGYDFGTGITVDASGCAYITGETSTKATFPVVAGPDLIFNGALDAFVAKVRANGSGLVYIGYLGGNADDSASAIAVDTLGYAYITGRTSSTEATFPETVGPDLYYNNCYDAFVAKIKPDGTGLVYCGYLGGSREDKGTGIAVDAAGYAYVTGYTYGNYDYVTKTMWPVVKGPDLTQNGDCDAFVVKVKPDGTGYVYAGFLGGAGFDLGAAIAVDSAGCAYVVGQSASLTGFPLAGGPSAVNAGGCDAFVTKIKADGSGIVYSGFVGGTGADYATGIALDAAGCAYVSGFTTSGSSFPVVVGPDTTYNGNGDAFVAKVKADGTGLLYSGFLGGSDFDFAAGIAVDSSGYAYLTGTTRSTQATFPAFNGPDSTYNGQDDAFVAKVAVDGSKLLFRGYLGGASNGTYTGETGNDYALAIALDNSGSLYVTGETGSSAATFAPVGGMELTYHGRRVDEVFVAKVAGNPVVSSLSATSGLTTGGNVVTLTGKNFTGTTAVYFGTTPAKSFTIVNTTTITAPAPAHTAGLVDVTVMSDIGVSSPKGVGNNYIYYLRTEESSSLLAYSKPWATSLFSNTYSGGYVRTLSSSAPLSFTFTGNNFRIVAAKGPGFGKLKVTLDGVLQTVSPDLYAATACFQQVVYVSNNMRTGTHTVVIDYSGQRNTLSSGTAVNLDAVDVIGTVVAR